MSEEITPRKDSGASKESMMPIDDPVGAALRRLHDEVVAEPLPDDFLRLLGEIEHKINGSQAAE